MDKIEKIAPFMCPFCGGKSCLLYYMDKRREYFICDVCGLVFVHPDDYVDVKRERERYCIHQNTEDNKGYVAFLSRVIKPVMERYSDGAVGLDFGSGPEPVLVELLKKEGFDVKAYDVFFADDQSVFDTDYDFITMTEVIEHLKEPEKELKRLWNRLKANGIMVIMTQVLEDTIRFSDWFYKNDETHICFYQWETVRWLAEYLNANLERVDRDIFVLSKGF